MASGKKTRRIQGAVEVTPGTPVTTSTWMWRGEGTPEDTRVVTRVAEDIGIIVPTNRTYTAKLAMQFDFDKTPATFEQLPYIGAAGIKNVTTGAADGAGTSKIYAYTFPTAATKNTISTYTLKGGDAASAEVAEYCFVSEFELSGGGGEAMMVSAKWLGRQLAAGASFTAVSAAAVDEILFGANSLYIDASGGTLGATIKSSTISSFSLKCKTGWVPIWLGDGLYFTLADFGDPEVTLDITFLHDAISVAGKAAWRAETGQLIRLKIIGPAVGTPGTTYTYKTLQLDVAGKWSKFAKVGEKDGIDIMAGTLIASLDSTASLYFNMTVVNELTSLT